MKPRTWLAWLGFFAASAGFSAAQSRTVAITIDDLPFVSGSAEPLSPHDAPAAAAANQKLLNAIARHRVPITGFVIEQHVEQLGNPAGAEILQQWVSRGLDLGNHTYAHLDFDDQSVDQYQDQIVRGESTIVPLMRAAHRKVEFFRFPFNHTGDTEAKHEAMAEFLRGRGYRLAPCTIETSDYIFAASYARMAARHDRSSQARLRREYLAFTAAQIDYFSRMNAQVLGYEPPEIMLLHDNQLNADLMRQILALFQSRGYKFVSLDQAERDPVYQSPDKFITKYGPMWGYRWARERGVKVDGSKEPEPPSWVAAYGNEPEPPKRPRSSF